MAECRCLPDTVRVIEWPMVEPVSLSEAKLNCGLSDDQTDYDAFLLDKLAAARRFVEQRLSTTLVATKRRVAFRSPPTRVLTLPFPPLLVDELHPITVTAGGLEVTESGYEIDADATPATLTLTADHGAPVVITYWAGVAEGQRICPMIRSAILAFVRHWFDYRGVIAEDGNAELPQAVEALLAASSWNGGW
jgi:uncharacterized phiE125 gp8 family phage protein